MDKQIEVVQKLFCRAYIPLLQDNTRNRYCLPKKLKMDKQIERAWKPRNPNAPQEPLTGVYH